MNDRSSFEIVVAAILSCIFTSAIWLVGTSWYFNGTPSQQEKNEIYLYSQKFPEIDEMRNKVLSSGEITRMEYNSIMKKANILVESKGLRNEQNLLPKKQ